MTAKAGMIRVGVGGWTFDPWRGVFFPDRLPHARELEYAASRLTTIEINGTYYRTQKPETFAKWAAETRNGFVFSVKALRYTTNRKVLAEAGESVGKFLNSGLSALGDKLGPVLWQFAPTKRFDADDFAGFLALLPDKVEGLPLRHALEVRHDSFRDPVFVEMVRKRGAAIVYADSDKYPSIPDQTGPFTYARLQSAREDVETGYNANELKRWATVAQEWAAGRSPQGLHYVSPPPPKAPPRDAFIFFINGAKVRAPAAAEALITHL